MSDTAEQRARDMLERMEVPNAQSFSAGEIVELANLVDKVRGLGWRPIGTAPTSTLTGDHPKTLLLWVANGGLDHRGACAFGVVYETETGRHINAHGYLGQFNVTHWMPLPEPPEAVKILSEDKE